MRKLLDAPADPPLQPATPLQRKRMVLSTFCERNFAHLFRECMKKNADGTEISRGVRFDMFMTLYVNELTEHAERLDRARRYMHENTDWTLRGLNDLIDEYPKGKGIRATLRWHWSNIVHRQDQLQDLVGRQAGINVFRALTGAEPLRPVSVRRHGAILSVETAKLRDWRRLYRLAFGEGRGSDSTSGFSSLVTVDHEEDRIPVSLVGLQGPDATPQTRDHEVQHALHEMLFMQPEPLQPRRKGADGLIQGELDFGLEDHKDEVLARTVDSDGMHRVHQIDNARDTYFFPRKNRILDAMNKTEDKPFTQLWNRTIKRMYPLRANIQRHVGEVLRDSLAGGDSTMFHVFELAPARMWMPLYRHIHRHGLPNHDTPEMPNPAKIIDAARSELIPSYRRKKKT